jgi:outer membrane protein assembly factor BamB
MRIRSSTFLATTMLAIGGCGESAVTEPEILPPVDHVEAVVAGRVTDAGGNPVEGAYAYVTLECSSDPEPGCLTATGGITDADGRFVLTFEFGFQSIYPVRARVEVTPPLGMGYVLGEARIEDSGAVFQVPPAADTTFVALVLPPNTVDSRRPIRIQSVGHRTGGLRADRQRVYLSSPSGVTAMDPRTGECLWQRGSVSGLAGPAYALVGDVVAIARGGSLSAFRAIDGEMLWSRDAVPNRRLRTGGSERLFATDGLGVVAYDVRTGETRWRRELIGNGNVALAADEGLVCAEILAWVECWEPSSGESVWSRPTDFADWLAIAGERVILGSEAGWSALDAGTGEKVWEIRFERGYVPALSEAGDLAVACPPSECVAVRTEDGEVAWRTSIEGFLGGPAVADGVVYVPVREAPSSGLYLLDAATGAVRDRVLPDPFDGDFYGTPAVGTDFVFVFGGFGNLYTFEKAP